MKSILIADDHPAIRLGILLIVKNMFMDAQVLHASTFGQTITRLEEMRFDLLVLDINIPGGNNLQMIHAVRLRQPDIKILIFSAYEEQMYALNYIQAGADGYLVKDSPEEDLRTALCTVLNNEKYISRAVKDQLLCKLQHSRPATENPLMLLSAREREVLNLLLKGTSTAKIAKTLHVQTTTVSTYKARIFEKMEVSNFVDLMEKVKLYNHPAG